MHQITLPTTNERKITANPLQFDSRYLVRRGPSTGNFLIMTYGFNIDQEFAIVNELTLTQVSTLAAFMTLPIWAKTVAIDGFVWYQYSEEKMADDFPLLFGVAKRCYKNISELAALGFVELTKLGHIKYVRFTPRCADWNKKKEQIRSNSPKTDQSSPEIDQISPKMDRDNNVDYNIINSNIKDKDISADGVLFQPEPASIKQRGTTEQTSCLFANSRYADFEKFSAEFTDPKFAGIDIVYYFHAVADWSAGKGRKMKDWIATARNFIRRDIEGNKLHRIGGGLSPDAIQYLQDMAD